MINKEEGNGAVRKKEARYPTFGWEGFRETNKCWLKRSHESFISWFLTATSPNSFTINFHSPSVNMIQSMWKLMVNLRLEGCLEVEKCGREEPTCRWLFFDSCERPVNLRTNLYLHTSSRVNLWLEFVTWTLKMSTVGLVKVKVGNNCWKVAHWLANQTLNSHRESQNFQHSLCLVSSVEM